MALQRLHAPQRRGLRHAAVRFPLARNGFLKQRGAKEDKAEEIAARTVNKERARSGEARQASRTSINDISSERRGGLRSHTGSKGRTYAQLRNEARERGIKGRSRMNKAQLQRAVDTKKR